MDKKEPREVYSVVCEMCGRTFTTDNPVQSVCSDCLYELSEDMSKKNKKKKAR